VVDVLAVVDVGAVLDVVGAAVVGAAVAGAAVAGGAGVEGAVVEGAALDVVGALEVPVVELALFLTPAADLGGEPPHALASAAIAARTTIAFGRIVR